jgi:hypothetical protein
MSEAKVCEEYLLIQRDAKELGLAVVTAGNVFLVERSVRGAKVLNFSNLGTLRVFIIGYKLGRNDVNSLDSASSINLN